MPVSQVNFKIRLLLSLLGQDVSLQRGFKNNMCVFMGKDGGGQAIKLGGSFE